MSTIPKDLPALPHTDSDSSVSFEDFLRLYSDTEDGFKYEWNNGKIEKTTKMDQQQSTLQDTFLRIFVRTNLFKNGGMFVAETDMKTSVKQLRRPDLAIYSANQKEKMAVGHENQIAIWVGEVISESDNINHVKRKLYEYFEAGVKVVWHIFPSVEEVSVYTAPDEVTICRGKRICSAKPALNDFEISATDVFAYKNLLKKKS